MWGYPWSTHEMTIGQYNLLLALEELSENKTPEESEEEFISKFKKRMEEKKKNNKENVKTENTETDIIKQVQEKIKQGIIENKNG